jgi:hypothetical protein
MKNLNLFQKINEIQKKVKSVHKGSTVKINDRSSYTAVSHDDVTSLLHDPIAEFGIVAMPRMETCELEIIETQKEYQGKITTQKNYLVRVWASVTFFNSEDKSDQFQTQCFAYAIDSGDKATGKAYSMAIKYCYLKTFMLESLDDEESRDWENSSYNSAPNYSNVSNNTHKAPVGASNNSLASDAQRSLLKRLGIEFQSHITKNEASKLIEANKK